VAQQGKRICDDGLCDRFNQGGEREGLDQAAADLNGAPDWLQVRSKRLEAV
jgi:hypothetical protein